MSSQLQDEQQVVFSQAVLSGQVVRLTQDFTFAGKITQVLFHFPPGCAGLVDMKLVKDENPFYPIQGYLALDNATPVHYVEADYYAHEPLTVEIRNRDALNTHQPTCTVTIRYNRPPWL